MEAWQKEHIRKHLPRLIATTSCATNFLAILQSVKIISAEEVSSLELPLKTISDKANDLYKIIQTRVGGYNGVKEALLKTDQTGAYDILSEVNCNNFATEYKNVGAITYDKNILLGRGCLNTEVYKGKFQNREAAVKIININYVDVGKVLEEVDFLVKLDQHENIVRHLSTEITEYFALIALELCSCNLHDLVKGGGVFQIGALEILRQSTNGIDFLHSKKIIHRDLKPANILIAHIDHTKIKVKISDFGMSRRIPEGGSRLVFHSTGVGTEGWIAPEVLAQFYDEEATVTEFKMGLPADIFSLGCIFYFVLSEGKHPFGTTARQTVNILDGRYTVVENEIKNIEENKPEIILLVKIMIAHSEKERPTAADVLSHAAFTAFPNSKNQGSGKDVLLVPKPTNNDFPTKPFNQNMPPVPKKRSVANLSVVGGFVSLWNEKPAHEAVQNRIEQQRMSNSSDSYTKVETRKIQTDNLSNHFDEAVVVQEDFVEEPVKTVASHEMALNIRTENQTLEKMVPLETKLLHHRDTADRSVKKLDNQIEPDINGVIDDKGNTRLHKAAEEGDMEAIINLLKNGANVNATNRRQDTALHLIAGSNKEFDRTLTIIDTLIANNADVYLQSNFYRYTFLHYLVKREKNKLLPIQFQDICQFIVSNNHSNLFNIGDYMEATPILLAAKYIKILPKTLDLLQANGVNINATDMWGNSVLSYALEGYQSMELISTLIDRGADNMRTNYEKENFIHIAVYHKNFEAVKYFLDLGLNPNDKTKYGETALHYLDLCDSKKENIIKIAKLLVDCGADRTCLNIRNRTLLEEVLCSHELTNEDKEKIKSILSN